MIDCTIVACSIVPDLDPDDRLLADELQARGVSLAIATWNDPAVDWAASSLCLVRSTWDYHTKYREFMAWIEATAPLTQLRNRPHLLRWNAHKSYLRDLERHGVPIVPTAWVARDYECDLAQLRKDRGWVDVVLKPAKGAAGHGVALLRREAISPAQAQAALDELAASHDVLVQPYLPAVAGYGERALMFFQGSYSHAVVKKPFDRDLAVSDARSSLVEPTPQEIEVAASALAAAPGRALYARVDLLHDEAGTPLVSELELIEPALYFAVYPPAVSAFAQAVVEELDELHRSDRPVHA